MTYAKTISKLMTILLGLALILNIFPLNLYADEAANTSDEELENDLILYEKYQQYEKYEHYQDYKDYKKAKNKYGFESSADRISAKNDYDRYKETKNQIYYAGYKKYKGYKNKYKPLTKYAKYGKYSKYDKDSYKKYGSSEYKNGYNRYKNYLASTGNVSGDLGEADLGGGALGPEITVGLWNYTRDDLRDSPFKLEANRDYTIKNGDGTVVGQVLAGVTTRVTYTTDGNLKIYGSITDTLSAKEVFFEDTAGDNSAIIFDIYRPNSDFDQYRGKVKLRYNTSSKLTWVINTLSLEHYVWGMGEITGTGDTDYNRVMTTSFRTYGYWKLKFSTKYSADGFKVNATPGNQLYYGYDWETGHTRIKDAAIDTQGKIVMYKKQIAITPYSSWTDGKTRSFEERWGSNDYPWCQSVNDPYGKHPTKSTATLVAEGNHMVGLSAHGALNLADEHNWDWDKILKYYYTNIDIKKVY
ncbi:MAG: hypothetical protein WC682_03340 [Parcubacteria group bacterium]|jgi:hypothetical protein